MSHHSWSHTIRIPDERIWPPCQRLTSPSPLPAVRTTSKQILTRKILEPVNFWQCPRPLERQTFPTKWEVLGLALLKKSKIHVIHIHGCIFSPGSWAQSLGLEWNLENLLRGSCKIALSVFGAQVSTYTCGRWSEGIQNVCPLF